MTSLHVKLFIFARRFLIDSFSRVIIATLRMIDKKTDLKEEHL